MTTGDARAYSSPLRAEQAAATRERIVDATVALLQEGDVSSFSMQDVADRAGVAVRTVYRAFPTKDDLIAGLLESIRERFGAAGAMPADAAELRATVDQAVRTVYELEPLYRALFATAQGREAHAREAPDRLAAMKRMFSTEVAGLQPEQVRLFATIVHLLTSSNSLLFLKTYGGLDADEAARAIGWLLDAVTAAVNDPERRARLGQPEGGRP